MIRQRVVVRGCVQGVFFRASCRDEADRLGVAGWVGNRPDGAVEAVFEGEETAVTQMVTWAHDGPLHATVESVEVTDDEPQGENGFSVR